MKAYVVILSVKPAVRLEKDLSLDFKEAKGSKKLEISKIGEKDVSGNFIQTGFRIRVFLQANSLDEARIEAAGFADAIVSFMTLTSGIAMNIPREELAYEITPNVEKREFVQIDYIHLNVSRRVLDHQVFIQLIDKFTKLSPVNKVREERVARAIRWYRAGSMTTDVFDQFNCFWIGLESLNRLLQDEYSIGDDPTTCPNCKHKWISHPTVSGIRKLVQETEGRELYKRIRNLRIDIMHSKKKLKELLQPAFELTPKVAELLFRAICYLLGIENWDSISYRDILEKVPIRLELRTMLVGGDPASLGPNGEDPHFKAKHDFKLKVSKDGIITYKVLSSFTAHLNSNVKFSSQDVRLFGDSEITGEITKIEV